MSRSAVHTAALRLVDIGRRCLMQKLYIALKCAAILLSLIAAELVHCAEVTTAELTCRGNYLVRAECLSRCHDGRTVRQGPEMIRLCDACKAQITKGPDDHGHPGLKFVFKGPGRERQYLCINCGETIFHNPDITPAWRADL